MPTSLYKCINWSCSSRGGDVTGQKSRDSRINKDMSSRVIIVMKSYWLLHILVFYCSTFSLIIFCCLPLNLCIIHWVETRGKFQDAIWPLDHFLLTRYFPHPLDQSYTKTQSFMNYDDPLKMFSNYSFPTSHNQLGLQCTSHCYSQISLFFTLPTNHDCEGDRG